MKVYVKLWFEMKKIGEAIHGARHMHRMINKNSFFPEECKLIAHEVIQMNSYLSHSEIILLAKMFDERTHIRELVLKNILKSRKTDCKEKILQFDLPNFSFQADGFFI